MKRAMLNLMIPGLLLGGMSLAQETDQDSGPGRGVARLSLLAGDVSVRRGDSGDLVAAALNAPVMADDRVMTGPGARAEVQFDYYHRIRLAQDTELRLTQLENRMYQMQVARGTVTFTALEGGDAQVEVSIPGAAVRPMAYGNYRVSVYPDGTADISVRSGEAEVYTPSGSELLHSGRTMRVRAVGATETEFQFLTALPQDAWDEFNERRDKELRRAESAYQYVSKDIYGAEDLTGHGEWVNTAPYGYSWQPYVAADWTPYRNGRWTWADYYGWTWVSYDPWGWAPYHYGRWFNNGGRWCWYPGAIRGSRHYWSPALVGWVGWDSWGGFGAGAGYGWGAVGWVPLAPFEPIHRWWGHGWYNGYRGGHNNTTIVNNVNITNVYRNARVNNGVTVINGGDFRKGEYGRTLRVTNEDFGRANMARGMVPVAPGRENLRMTDRDAVVIGATIRAGNTTAERFYSKRPTPVRADRVPFDEQRRSMERLAMTNVPANVPRSGEAPRSTEGGGWRRAGEGTTAHESVNTPATPASGGSDWRRFGDPGMGSRSTSESNRQSAPAGDDTGRAGWRGFGDPSRTNRTSEQPKQAETSRPNPNEGRRVETAPRPQPEAVRSWTGGGGGSRSEAPRSEGPRVERSAPSPSGGSRSEAPRSESPHVDRSAPSTGGGSRGETPKSEPTRGSGRGNEFSQSMTPGAWSTGRAVDSTSSYEIPRGGYSAPHLSSPAGATQNYEIPRGGYSPPHLSSPGGDSGGIGGGGGMRSGGTFGVGSVGGGGTGGHVSGSSGSGSSSGEGGSRGGAGGGGRGR